MTSLDLKVIKSILQKGSLAGNINLKKEVENDKMAFNGTKCGR